MQLAQNVVSAEHSATLAVKDKIDELRAEGADVINMAPGSPDFDTPAYIKRGAEAALADGKTRTTAIKGLPRLREAIAQKLRIENDVEADPEDIVVTPGSKFAIFQSIFATLEAGDEAVVLDPSWVSYSQMVTLVGGELNRVTLDAETGFAVDEDALAESVTDETELLVLNNPSNPTGAVFSRDDLSAIRDLAVDHDFWVVSDEIYEKLLYGAEFHSIGSLDGMADRTITVNGFSKTYAMTGWRLGYLAAPPRLVNQIEKIQSHSVSCPTSFVQYAGVDALEGPQDETEAMRQTYESRLEVLMDELADAGVTIPKPEGAFYAFVPVRTDDDAALCERMLDEEHVAVSPGSAFGVSGYVRISCTTDAERIGEGVRRIAPYLGRE